MRRTALRALVFAAALVAATVIADLAFAVLYQGGPAPGRTRQFWTFRAALHGATFVLTMVGGAVGFAPLRSREIGSARIAALGAVLGLVTLPALFAAIQAGGFRGMALLLLAGSAVAAFAGGRWLGRST